MIRKSTLLFLLCAIVAAGVFSYLEIKKKIGTLSAGTADNTKLAFSVPSSDIASVTLSHPTKPEQPSIELEKNKDTWRIVQPIAAPADQSAVGSVLDDLTTAKPLASTEPATADRLRVYGLGPPQLEVEFRLKNGVRHTLQLGNKDFTGSSVYAIVDGAKTVALLPQAVLTAPDSSLESLRDHTVLNMTADQVASFTLKNPSGEIALTKTKDQWNFTKPGDALADPDLVQGLLTEISNARLTNFVSEKQDDLKQYGLENPAIDFTFVDDTGKKSTLSVGKKDGTSGYFARDPLHAGVIAINTDLYTQLAKGYSYFRDKKVLHFDASNITHVEFQNSHGLTAVTSTVGNNWVFNSPAAQKGKDASSFKVFRTLVSLRADQVIDHPQPAMLAKLAKPAIEVVLTDKNGKKLTLKISQLSGDVAYAQTSDSPAVWVIKKQDFDDLNLEPSSLLDD